MIEKLKEHSVEEIKAELSAANAATYGDLFSHLTIRPLPPTNEEIVNKINEIIDCLNEKEEK